MKFLVLGCNGMAGHTISLYLIEQGHVVLGFGKSKSGYIDSVVGDAFDTQLLRRLITNGNFDSIINCIGVLNDFAEKSKASATFLNSYLPHFLAEITQNTDTQVIQMSTDCVFSGKRGNYTEYDFRDGDTFYDRSKALGELNDNKNITLRNSIIGPDINSNGIGLLNWLMQQQGEVTGYTRSIWTGQTTLQLAKTMEYAAKEKASGLVNSVPESSISKYDLLILLNQYLRNNSLNIIPVEGIIADKSLKRTNYDFKYPIPDYETMVAEMAVWIKNHKKLYLHYNINF
jgi:dTDP-4-dehydrorhamnose reductase